MSLKPGEGTQPPQRSRIWTRHLHHLHLTVLCSLPTTLMVRYFSYVSWRICLLYLEKAVDNRTNRTLIGTLQTPWDLNQPLLLLRHSPYTLSYSVRHPKFVSWCFSLIDKSFQESKFSNWHAQGQSLNTQPLRAAFLLSPWATRLRSRKSFISVLLSLFWQ